MPTLLSAVIFSLSAAAQDARVSAATPSRDSAILLLDEVWSDLPEDGVVIYLDCGWPDCHGQVPDWFEREGWSEGLIEGGLVLRSEDLGIAPETLELLWQVNHDRPPLLALLLARQLDDSEANALLYVRPRAREHRLDLSWEIYEMRTGSGPLRGRIIFRPLPPPLPDPRDSLVPWAQHRSVWGGAGLVLAGSAVIGGTWSAWNQGASVESTGLAVLNTTGWLSVMGGGTMMALPLILRN